jgi:hypothetical protein
MATEAEDITYLTRELRESHEPFWSRVRQLLLERELDPASLALVASFPDDVQYEYGVVVTADGRIYQFGLDYLHVDVALGTFKEWRDFTGQPAPHPCSTQQLEIGLKVARGEPVAL